MGANRDPTEGKTLPRPGAVIHGTTLRVVGMIGGGELGIVLLCDDEALRRQVAVKVLRPDRADPRRVATFLELARATARVISPNVVAVYDVGIHEGLPFDVMEHVPGEPLDVHRKGRGGKVPLKAALLLADGMLRGLEALHAEGIPHGAIGHSNVLVAPDGRVVITDAGMSNVAVASLRPVATAHMRLRVPFAPEDTERTLGAAKKMDVCGVAALTYELITGVEPARTPGGRLVVPSELTRSPAPLDDALSSVLDDPRSPLRAPRVLRLALEAVAKRLGDDSRLVRVLLVDADDRSASETEKALGRLRMPVEVSRATSARMALFTARHETFELVLVSPNLSDMSGFEVVSSLCALEGMRHTPLVVLSRTGSAQDFRLLSGLGAAVVIPVPVDSTLLAAVLEGQLDAAYANRPRRGNAM